MQRGKLYKEKAPSVLVSAFSSPFCLNGQLAGCPSYLQVTIKSEIRPSDSTPATLSQILLTGGGGQRKARLTQPAPSRRVSTATQDVDLQLGVRGSRTELRPPEAATAGYLTFPTHAYILADASQ